MRTVKSELPLDNLVSDEDFQSVVDKFYAEAAVIFNRTDKYGCIIATEALYKKDRKARKFLPLQDTGKPASLTFRDLIDLLGKDRAKAKAEVEAYKHFEKASERVVGISSVNKAFSKTQKYVRELAKRPEAATPTAQSVAPESVA